MSNSTSSINGNMCTAALGTGIAIGAGYFSFTLLSDGYQLMSIKPFNVCNIGSAACCNLFGGVLTVGGLFSGAIATAAGYQAYKAVSFIIEQTN